MLSKEASSTIFWVFSMTWSGIELWSPRPLANTLTIINAKSKDLMINHVTRNSQFFKIVFSIQYKLYYLFILPNFDCILIILSIFAEKQLFRSDALWDLIFAYCLHIFCQQCRKMCNDIKLSLSLFCLVHKTIYYKVTK